KSGHDVSAYGLVIGDFLWRNDNDKTTVEIEDVYDGQQEEIKKDCVIVIGYSLWRKVISYPWWLDRKDFPFNIIILGLETEMKNGDNVLADKHMRLQEELRSWWLYHIKDPCDVLAYGAINLGARLLEFILIMPETCWCVVCIPKGDNLLNQQKKHQGDHYTYGVGRVKRDSSITRGKDTSNLKYFIQCEEVKKKMSELDERKKDGKIYFQVENKEWKFNIWRWPKRKKKEGGL
ncbi:hypothetical protein Tco_1382394, partial [Tanacetum coccineum]